MYQQNFKIFCVDIMFFIIYIKVNYLLEHLKNLKKTTILNIFFSLFY